MSSIVLKQTPPAYFFQERWSTTRIVLHVEDTPQFNEYVDFLRLVYNVRIRRPKLVVMGVWQVKLNPAPHFSLAGVRVAGRLYGVSYEIKEVGI